MAEVQTRSSQHNSYRSSRHPTAPPSSTRSHRDLTTDTTDAVQASLPITADMSAPSADDSAQKLKAKYAAGLLQLGELFPHWSEDDLLYLLADTQGDVAVAVARITEGHASQWGEVKKKTKERSKSKGPFTNSENPRSSASSTRGRGRGGLESRGRGRGDRGRSRGKPNGRVPHETADEASYGGNSAADASTPVDAAWGTTPTEQSATDAPITETAGDWNSAPAPVPTTNGSWDAAPASVPDSLDTSLPTAAPSVAPPKPAVASSTVIKSGTKQSWASIAKPAEPKPMEPPKAKPMATPVAPVVVEEPVAPTPAAASWDMPVPEASFSDFGAPATDDWGSKAPVATAIPETFAEAAAMEEPGAVEIGAVDIDAPAPAIAAATGAPTASSKVPPGLAGKSMSGRSPAYSRILTQDAPVVMPGSMQTQVDRAGLQFGSLNLEEQTEDMYEEAEGLEIKETPAYSQELPLETMPPVPPQQAQVPTPAQQQGLSGFGQFGLPGNRYQPPMPQQPTQQQKAFEPFSQSPYGAYPTQTHMPGMSGFPSEFQNPYAGDLQRGYNYYGTPYQQQMAAAGGQDGLPRGASTSLEQLTPSSTSTQQQPGRFGVGGSESSVSPAPSASPAMSTQHSQYGIHPYYLSPAYTAYYMNNFQGYYGQQQAQPQPHFGQQKSAYGQQPQSQFYGDHYSRQQQQQQVQQQQHQPPQGQPAMPSQQSPLGGIQDFLQDGGKAGNARGGAGAQGAQQVQQGQVQGQVQSQQVQQQIPPQQQNAYGGFAGYGYGQQQQQQRQGAWNGYH
ncbi:uncharacterized protein V1518DRAFT_140124 [Limtongia smithiae]|uniref:uncharacterized protein n=1 Tax=Limtongia smithiae TaxID=1125753 RepID=UPI0034CDD632